MTVFRYKAVTADGRIARGQLDAGNASDLETRLKRLQLDLVRSRPVGERGRFGGGRVPRRELITFCFHLEQLSRAGVPIIDGLADLRDSSEHRRLREVVASVIESIAGGKTLSEAMASHPPVFDEVFVSLIRAGESSGRLPEVLSSLTAALKWEDELAAHTRKLLLYPAFVGAVALAATVFLLLVLVPQLKPFVQQMGQALPPHTRLLFFVADLVAASWPLALLLPAVAGLAGRQLLQRSPAARRRADGLKLQLPVVGEILRKIMLSRFAATFALLYASGIPVLDALRTTRTVAGNRAIEAGLARVEQLIGEGHDITGAFAATGLFPPLVIRMLKVGEGTGALDRALANVSYFYNRDVKEGVARVQAMVEPTLTLLLGGLLGWIMLAVLGPIYDVIGRIRL